MEDVQFGFTADDRLNSDNEFLDHSPADGFPFMGVNTYLVGTQRFGDLSLKSMAVLVSS